MSAPRPEEVVGACGDRPRDPVSGAVCCGGPRRMECRRGLMRMTGGSTGAAPDHATLVAAFAGANCTRGIGDDGEATWYPAVPMEAEEMARVALAALPDRLTRPADLENDDVNRLLDEVVTTTELRDALARRGFTSAADPVRDGTAVTILRWLVSTEDGPTNPTDRAKAWEIARTVLGHWDAVDRAPERA